MASPMLHSIDMFFAKHVFVPPVLALLQRTQMTQYAFHRYCWFIYSLYAFYICASEPMKSVSIIIASVLTAIFMFLMMISASMLTDKPIPPRVYIRIFFIGFGGSSFVSDLIKKGAMVALSDEFYLFVIMILFAEYALLIDKVPPRKTKEKKERRVFSPST